jgi:hypothetical protein
LVSLTSMSYSRATTGADTMLTLSSSGRSSPARITLVIGRVLSWATSPS